MNVNDNETVREVCAEIQLQTHQTMFRTSDVIGWRDRILAAYDRELSAHEREMAAKDAEIARLKECHCEYALPDHGCMAEDKHFHKTVELERKVALLERALKPVMECVCNPSTPTPWFVSNDEIHGKADYKTQFPDEDGEEEFDYCDSEAVCQCYYNERCGVNPANGCTWTSDENAKPMAIANEQAIVNSVNAVREAQRVMREGCAK